MPPSFFGGVSGEFVRILTFLSIVVLFNYLELQFGLDGFLKFNIHMKTGSLHSAIKPATNEKPKVKARRKLRRKMSRMNLDNKKKDTKTGGETKSKSKRWVTFGKFISYDKNLLVISSVLCMYNPNIYWSIHVQTRS